MTQSAVDGNPENVTRSTATNAGVVPGGPPSNADGANKTKSEARISLGGLQLNINYFLTIVGILKGVEWLFGIICIGCASPAIIPGAHWFLFVVVLCFIFTFIWACIHFFSITTVIRLPWVLMEISYTALATLLYFTAFITMFAQSNERYYYAILDHFDKFGAYMAAAVFGLFNFILYAGETFLHGRVFIQERQAQNPS